MAAVKTKKKQSSKKNVQKPVNSVAPGTPITLDVQQAPLPPVQEVKIDPTKRITDTTGRLERMLMIQQFASIYKEDGGFLKDLLVKEGAKYIDSARATGQLSSSGTGRYIDPAKFFALVRKKGIKAQQYLEAVSITIKPCEQFLSQTEIDSICVTPPVPPAPRFNVDIKTGVPPVTLVEAVNALAAEFKPQEVPAPVGAE